MSEFFDRFEAGRYHRGEPVNRAASARAKLPLVIDSILGVADAP